MSYFDIRKLCINCMHVKKTAGGRCEACGFLNEEYVKDPEMLEPLTLLNGRYLTGRRIGKGGFGYVYIAWDLTLQIKAAVKELFPRQLCSRNPDGSLKCGDGKERIFAEVRRQFLREARILASLEEQDSRGIVRVRDYFEENGTGYIVMELLAGKTLKEYVGEKGRLSREETRQLLTPAAESLICIHSRGILHRDISPDNIMLVTGEGCKLLDFGGAAQSGRNDPAGISTCKRGYAPPEQYTVSGKVTEASDVYALAATAVFCLTGQKPAAAEEKGDEARRKMKTDLLSVVTEEEERILAKAMEAKTADRIRTVREFWNAFLQAGPDENPDARKEKSPGPHMPDKKKPVGKSMAFPAFLGALAAVVTGLVLLSVITKDSFSGSPETETFISSEAEEETRFRSIDLNLGDVICLGRQDRNGNEPIEWVILQKTMGEILVISRNCLLPAAGLAGSDTDVWEKSPLRNWLNTVFYEEVFSEEEKACIVLRSQSNPRNSVFGTGGGRDTEDRLFLLSAEEAEEYFPSARHRIAALSASLPEPGASRGDEEDAFWALRTSGAASHTAAVVRPDGTICMEGMEGSDQPGGSLGIRPALWLNISLLPAGLDVKKADIQAGDWFSFGAYPQDAAKSDEPELKPIEWEVLARKEEKILLVSRYCLASLPFHAGEEEVRWENCTLRRWLNEDFFQAVFSSDEKTRILSAPVSETVNPESGLVSRRTTDRLFLLSAEEAETYLPEKDDRKARPTEWAVTHDGCVSGDSGCWWFLRTPGNAPDRAAEVGSEGDILFEGSSVANGQHGIRPAMWVSIPRSAA